MTDILEKMIRENKEAFEVEAPDGHADRFARKLDQQFGKQRRLGWKQYLQLAAAILLVLLAGNQVSEYVASHRQQQPQPIGLSSVSPEYAEAEFYYTSSIDQGMRAWEQLGRDGFISANEQEVMKTEMAEFDETYARLQEELAANPEDERVIHAMLELYQAKLSIIKMIINKLEEIKHQKTTNHEMEI
ncbi:hypothetical protein [Gaoshiqia sediminis]|uniref:Anti-sigma factor n=1 Tax=Gaoshiqia sediminis TaxID=2986998 RepID=A0AA41Y974_9BACT|nr:hypothetical protein [Gaoshiqia sediminis]MCW0483911.1 hypothetical protein [Gaoshiqia sediminis]